jgi:hypothetical protein
MMRFLRSALAALVLVVGNAGAQARADWGLYGELEGASRQAAGGYRLQWEREGETLYERWINPANGKVIGTTAITRDPTTGHLKLDGRYFARHTWDGVVGADGSVVWTVEGKPKLGYLVRRGANGAIDVENRGHVTHYLPSDAAFSTPDKPMASNQSTRPALGAAAPVGGGAIAAADAPSVHARLNRELYRRLAEGPDGTAGVWMLVDSSNPSTLTDHATSMTYTLSVDGVEMRSVDPDDAGQPRPSLVQRIFFDDARGVLVDRTVQTLALTRRVERVGEGQYVIKTLPGPGITADVAAQVTETHVFAGNRVLQSSGSASYAYQWMSAADAHARQIAAVAARKAAADARARAAQRLRARTTPMDGDYAADSSGEQVIIEEPLHGLILEAAGRRFAYGEQGDGMYKHKDDAGNFDAYLRIVDDNTIESNRIPATAPPAIYRRMGAAYSRQYAEQLQERRFQERLEGYDAENARREQEDAERDAEVAALRQRAAGEKAQREGELEDSLRRLQQTADRSMAVQAEARRRAEQGEADRRQESANAQAGRDADYARQSTERQYEIAREREGRRDADQTRVDPTTRDATVVGSHSTVRDNEMPSQQTPLGAPVRNGAQMKVCTHPAHETTVFDQKASMQSRIANACGRATPAVEKQECDATGWCKAWIQCSAWESECPSAASSQ